MKESSLNLAPVSNDMAALPTLFAASMVAVCSAATGGLRGSKQDAMKEVSGTAKHYPKDWHKWLPGNNGLYDETSSGEQEVSGTAKHYPKDWHKWLPGNNGLYDETPSGEQDAMEEVSGTAKHYPK